MPTSFDFTCQECAKGTVVRTVFLKYPTKIQGHPFVVIDAVIGVCNKCSAKHFSASEYKRWQSVFEHGA